MVTDVRKRADLIFIIPCFRASQWRFLSLFRNFNVIDYYLLFHLAVIPCATCCGTARADIDKFHKWKLNILKWSCACTWLLKPLVLSFMLLQLAMFEPDCCHTKGIIFGLATDYSGLYNKFFVKKKYNTPWFKISKLLLCSLEIPKQFKNLRKVSLCYRLGKEEVGLKRWSRPPPPPPSSWQQRVGSAYRIIAVKVTSKVLVCPRPVPLAYWFPGTWSHIRFTGVRECPSRYSLLVPQSRSDWIVSCFT